MLSKEMSQKIREAMEEMDLEDFQEYLLDLYNKDVFELSFEEYDYAISFAKHLISQMNQSFDNDEWCGYEIKALYALDELAVGERDIIIINSYGYAQKIESNEELLDVLGIELYEEE